MKEKMTKDQKRQQLRERNTPPHLSVLEEVGNAITHGIGALVALVGMILLLLKSNSSEKIIAALILAEVCFF